MTVAVVEAVVHEQIEWRRREPDSEGFEDYDCLADLERMAQTVVRERTHSSAMEGLDARSEADLVQRSQVVFAAPVHVHCFLKALHLQAPAATHYYFVGSFHRPEKTAQMGGHDVSCEELNEAAFPEVKSLRMMRTRSAEIGERLFSPRALQSALLALFVL